ncbi:transposase [Leptolyngbya sp. FACHB-60]|uniref:transposase n=1 Tax=Cyanophyceae TaxID=3028117 RepID=UPI001681D1F5|nr:transposase [Phormidium sp. FACHB-77]MBD2031487.1 transposase [Phormidium sp. FACHB-322]MBD2052886.1 transposase [Leptolyngbya sp. FACHB-60]
MELSRRECIELLEQIRWGGEPQCPYCGSRRASPIEKGLRHHCNACFTSYSVTVGTLFHQTHVDLQKWFRTILLVQASSGSISSRKLACEIGVSKNTAAQMLKRLREVELQERRLLRVIAKAVDKL